MSVLDQIRELEAKKQKLLATAKVEALQKANAAINELSELGFHYELVERDAPQRRTGVRETVLKAVSSAADGITPAQIAVALNMDNKAGKQSVSNALAALKKAGTVSSQNGVYRIN